jgi:hypothetical protein
MFTSPKIGNQAVPAALRSSASLPKNMRPKRSNSSTDARLLEERFDWTLRRIGHAPRASGAISHPDRPTPLTSKATTIGAETGAMIARTTAATRGATARSTGRSAPRVVVEGCAEKSEASSNGSTKNLGRGVNPAREPVVLYPQGV